MRTITRDIAGAFIFSKDSKILLGKTGKGGVYEDMWVVPGGGIEDGETKLNAVKREAEEEVGLVIKVHQIEPVDKPSHGESKKILRDTKEEILVKMTFWDFKVQLDKDAKDIELNLRDDMSEARFFSMEDLNNMQLGGGTKASLISMGYLRV